MVVIKANYCFHLASLIIHYFNLWERENQEMLAANSWNQVKLYFYNMNQITGLIQTSTQRKKNKNCTCAHLKRSQLFFSFFKFWHLFDTQAEFTQTNIIVSHQISPHTQTNQAPALQLYVKFSFVFGNMMCDFFPHPFLVYFLWIPY